MSNISEQYRKSLLTDETGKLISQKLGGETTELSGVNTSAEFRKPLMSDETGKEILAKLDDVGGLPDVTEADNGNVLGVVEGAWAKEKFNVYLGKYDGENIPDLFNNLYSKVKDGGIVGFYYNKTLYIWNCYYSEGSGMVQISHEIFTAVVFDGTNVKIKIADYHVDQSGRHLDFSEKTVTTT